MNPLPGSINSHKHLFKLVQLLTYFTLKRRLTDAQITTKDILVKWFATSDMEATRLRVNSDTLIDNLNDLVMPFVLTCVYEESISVEKFGLTEPSEIKKEILHIINEYWLPF